MAQTMHQKKELGLTTLRELFPHGNPRLYRAYATTAFVLILVSILWTYSALVTDVHGAQWYTGFLPKGKVNGSKYDRHDWWTKPLDVHSGNFIPPKIWQIMLPKNLSAPRTPIEPNKLEETASWLALNPDYTYTLVGEEGGNEFVARHFANQPEIMDTYHKMPNVGMRSDLLRYLILGVEGGVYTDTDTMAIKPIDDWIPEKFKGQVRAVIGLEFDRRDGPGWADIMHFVQFCQWTIAAAPGHPVFKRMADRVVQSAKYLSAKHGIPIQDLKPESSEVMNSTGPAAWTDAVFEQLQEYDPSLNTTQDLSYMTEPRLIGDILVLTIDGFGMGQPHSASTNNGSIPEAALMAHHFSGSWRGD